MTDRARRVVRQAHDRAMLNPDARDLLLGILGVGTGGIANDVLQRLGVELASLRDDLKSLDDTAGAERSPIVQRPDTIDLIMEHACREARDLGDNWLGTEHVLLGIISLEDDPVARLLLERGLSRSLIIGQLRRLLGSPIQIPPSPGT